jgi:parallel beta-helix repeat protein
MILRFILVFCLCMVSPGVKATNYYCDPIYGSMSNQGSFTAPWSGLSSVFSTNKTFVGGDTIFLRTGQHGYTIVKGINTSNVVIMPQAGESPILSRIRVSTSAATPSQFWKLFKLTIQSESTTGTSTPAYSLVEIFPQASSITVSNCTITSSFNTTGWTRDDWRNRCNRGLTTIARLNSNHIIENNMITNVAFGLTISSSSTIVRGNKVQYFTNDGSRVLGSDILFEGNTICDLIKVMTNIENHDDLFQSFTNASGVGQDTLKNNIIRKNKFINISDTTRQYRGHAQGIGCFDGVFKNWKIENNIVLVDHWHGISFYGGENCTIINNTVLDPYPYSPIDPYDNNSANIGPSWIRIDKKPNGPASFGNVVKNNLVANAVIIAAPSMGTASNNTVVGSISNYASYFLNVLQMDKPALFDLRLKSGCSAIEAGDNIYAPTTDFDGVSRPQGMKVDVGSYEYVANTHCLGKDTSAIVTCTTDSIDITTLFSLSGLTVSWSTANPQKAPFGTHQLFASKISSGCRDTVSITVRQELANWTGLIDDDWHTEGNWDLLKIPTSKTHVLVNIASPNICTISKQNAQAASVQIKGSGKIKVMNESVFEVSGRCVGGG